MNPATFRILRLRNGGGRGWVEALRGLPFNHRAGGLRGTPIPFEIVERETDCTCECDLLRRRCRRTPAQHHPSHEGPWIGRTLVRPLRNESFLRCQDRKSTRLNSSHQIISYAVFCLK